MQVRGVLNRQRANTALARHAVAEAKALPMLAAGLSDLNRVYLEKRSFSSSGSSRSLTERRSATTQGS